MTDPDITPPYGTPIVPADHVPETAPVRPGLHAPAPDVDTDRLRSLEDMTIDQAIQAARCLLRLTGGGSRAFNDVAWPRIYDRLSDAALTLANRSDEVSANRMALVRKLMQGHRV